ncbi:hypothetical protein FRC96_11485 [Lujinxingia vulgaris]|uniref:Uncharacterized protein n=1 Tax=Lujinxingia vulgaris TaxID=2600176 RepID=A0A5C6X0C6_9DELT|nr:hypothetical protein [Lujinxingia vulgaris]TXD35290.1 hypothetical protein FRC96_11485 [Lujinxingia vulgaris]
MSLPPLRTSLRLLGLALAMSATSLLAAPAFAQAPTTLMQQGRLLSDDGEPMIGLIDMQFTIYSAESGGEVLWQDQVEVQLDASGFYSVALGDQGSPLDASIFAGGEAYVAIAIDGGEELSPRFKLHSVPYALNSAVAARAAVADQVAAGAVTRESLSEDVFDQTAAAVSCAPGQVAVASSSGWECGDLSGGLTMSQVRDALGQTLGDLSCSPSQTILFDGSAWTCADPVSYQAGAHLALNGTTFSVDTSELDAASLGGTDASGYLTASEVDSTYLSQADAASDYLALSGGTMSGDLVVRDFEVVKETDNSVSTGFVERTTTRMVIRNKRRRETVAIPRDRLHEICSDGCTYRIAGRFWNSQDQVEHLSAGPFHFSYDEPSGRWRDSRNAWNIAGNGSNSHVYNRSDCCYFTEQEYIAGSGQGDSSRDMYLLNNAASSCPNNANSALECILIFEN